MLIDVDQAISEGSYGRVYDVFASIGVNCHSIVKIFKVIPKNDKEIKILLDLKNR